MKRNTKHGMRLQIVFLFKTTYTPVWCRLCLLQIIIYTWLHLWITLHIIHQNHKYCLHFFYCFFSFRFFIDYFDINAWQLSMFTANCRREQKKIVAESRSTENTFWHFPMKRMNITDLNCLQKLMLLFVFWEVITL